jgi:histone H3/H4
MATRTVKRVWEVCEPHPDVFLRDPDPSLFAISLHHVAHGSADRDYTDAERFFSRTYMTRALSDLLERVIGRLAGQGRGAPILRLETPFGGGKTHTMTALYHIARSPEAAQAHESVQAILQRLNLRALPTRVHTAVLDGRALDVRERRTDDGLTIRTLWGELAYQLGGRDGYHLLADADETRTAPGSARLTEMLARYQPALILMDEVLEYLVKAQAVRVGDSNLMAQTGAFLGELTAAVGATPQSVLVLALPASSYEVPVESQEAVERLFQYAKKVLGRLEMVETPVAQDEVFGVLRRRLFKSVGNDREQRRAVEAMREYYDEYARFFPDRLRTPDYKERMLRAYPFHPELIDLLYERWGPRPQFQRTRGALRLLALVLRRLFNQRDGSALLIQPHHIDLADRHIRGEVVRLLDSGWDAIVTGDVLQRAREIEQKLGGDYAKEQLGKGAASCVFLYSISAATSVGGASEEELRTALLRPPINPALASEVLGRLREELWYLRYRDRRYLFTAKPNLNKVVLDYESEISDEAVEQALVERLKMLVGTGQGVFHVFVAPHAPALIPDRPQPTLAVLPLHEEQPHTWMQQAVAHASDGVRINKNMLVFLVPDRSRLSALRAALRRCLALEELARSPSFKEMEKDDQQQLKEQLKDKEAEVEALLRHAYQEIYRPSNGVVERVSVVVPPQTAKTLDEYVKQVLERAGILLERLAPEYLKEMLNIEAQREAPLAQASNLFTGVVGQPIPTKPQEVLQTAVREGVKQGVFGVRVGDQLYFGEEVPDDALKSPQAMLVAPTAVSVAPPQPTARPRPRALRVRTSANLLYPLLKVAESLRTLPEASICLEVHDPTGKLHELRAELDRLLQDYGCTAEWLTEE